MTQIVENNKQKELVLNENRGELELQIKSCEELHLEVQRTKCKLIQ
jgi:hypothetical protein